MDRATKRDATQIVEVLLTTWVMYELYRYVTERAKLDAYHDLLKAIKGVLSK